MSGSELRTWRESRALTQTALAHWLEVNTRTIQRLEASERVPFVYEAAVLYLDAELERRYEIV